MRLDCDDLVRVAVDGRVDDRRDQRRLVVEQDGGADDAEDARAARAASTA